MNKLQIGLCLCIVGYYLIQFLQVVGRQSRPLAEFDLPYNKLQGVKMNLAVRL